MTLQPWEPVSEESLVHYKVFDVRKTRRRSPRNGEEVDFFLIHTLDWVNVVALTRSQELILVRQYRHGSREFTLEIPGGVMHSSSEAPVEAPVEAAARELREETGYVASELIQIGSVRPNPAIFSNRCTMFLARDCEFEGELQQDRGEDLEVVLLPLAEVEERIRSGEIDHSLVVSGLYFHRLYDQGQGGEDKGV